MLLAESVAFVIEPTFPELGASVHTLQALSYVCFACICCFCLRTLPQKVVTLCSIHVITFKTSKMLLLLLVYHRCRHARLPSEPAAVCQ